MVLDTVYLVTNSNIYNVESKSEKIFVINLYINILYSSEFSVYANKFGILINVIL